MALFFLIFISAIRRTDPNCCVISDETQFKVDRESRPDPVSLLLLIFLSTVRRTDPNCCATSDKTQFK